MIIELLLCWRVFTPTDRSANKKRTGDDPKYAESSMRPRAARETAGQQHQRDQTEKTPRRQKNKLIFSRLSNL